MVEKLLSFCPTARKSGSDLGGTDPTEGKTAAQEAKKADSSDGGWAYRKVLDGKGVVTLPFTVIVIE